MNNPLPPPEPVHAPVSVSTEQARRLLRIHFSGIVLPEHFAVFATQLEEGVSRLGRGFVLITDLTGLESMHLDCVPYVTGAMDLFLASGVSKVIRIIPDPEKDIGLKLLSIVHYRGKVPTLTCKTRDEADGELTT
jgi:hypothetical protein